MVRFGTSFFSSLAQTAIVALGVLVSIWPLHGLLSEERPLSVPRSRLDVLLMLDTSGSMLQTDPEGLRYEGAKLLTAFLNEGDRLGIVQFAGEATVVQGLEDFSPKRIEQFTRKIRGIPTEGIFTDITAGMKVGAAVFDKAARDDSQRIIVVLSDGKVEPDPAVGLSFDRTLQLVHDILPELKAKEIRVFTLALSDQADRALLGEIAATTDGLTWYAKTAEDMHKSFAELFLAVKRPQVVAQKGQGFTIDGDVDEATFYINHAQGETVSLISPAGETMSAEQRPEYVTWFAGKNFDVITAKEPEAGLWQVVGAESEDGFAAVLTNLTLATDWPLVIRSGDEPLLQARLYEQKKPVSLPEMSSVVQFGFQIVPTDVVSEPVVREALSDNGERGDVVARDGIFSARVDSLREGAYKLTVAAKGPTFQRSQQIPFTVRPRLVTLEWRSPVAEFEQLESAATEVPVGSLDEQKSGSVGRDAGAPSISGDESTEFSVIISKEAVRLKSLEVSLEALSEDRRIEPLKLKRESVSSREYVAKADALTRSGSYKIKARIKGIDQRGDVVEGESTVIGFDFTKRSLSEASGGHAKPVHESSNETHTEVSDISFPVIPIVVISLVNALAFVAITRLVKKKKAPGSVVPHRYLPPAPLLEALERLETRATLTMVATDDPIFDWMRGSQGDEQTILSEEGEKSSSDSGIVEDSGSEESR